MRRKIMRAVSIASCTALLCCTAAFAGDNSKLFPRYEADYYRTGNPSAIASGQIAMQGRPEEIALNQQQTKSQPQKQVQKTKVQKTEVQKRKSPKKVYGYISEKRLERDGNRWVTKSVQRPITDKKEWDKYTQMGKAYEEATKDDSALKAWAESNQDAEKRMNEASKYFEEHPLTEDELNGVPRDKINQVEQMIVDSHKCQPIPNEHPVEEEIAEQWREEHRQEQTRATVDQAITNTIRIINQFRK